jgi:hypothetical protein
MDIERYFCLQCGNSTTIDFWPNASWTSHVHHHGVRPYCVNCDSHNVDCKPVLDTCEDGDFACLYRCSIATGIYLFTNIIVAEHAKPSIVRGLYFLCYPWGKSWISRCDPGVYVVDGRRQLNSTLMQYRLPFLDEIPHWNIPWPSAWAAAALMRTVILHRIVSADSLNDIRCESGFRRWSGDTEIISAIPQTPLIQTTRKLKAQRVKRQIILPGEQRP